MCTCVVLKGKSFYFGRNMDIEYSFNEQVIITPRDYILKFKKENDIKKHYAIIGIGAINSSFPLYADCMNEKGLCFASLNFPDNAYYFKYDKRKKNYTPYELPLIILGTCKNIKEVKKLLKEINIVNIPFNKELPLAPLHFMISDSKESIVVESTKKGLHVYDNPYHVLTNNPPFYFHLENIKNYLSLSNKNESSTISSNINLESYSNGQGALGLPGDYSSSSRFVKTFFIKENLIMNQSKEKDLIQFFKCLDSVSMVLGSVLTPLGYEYTSYQSCMDAKNLIYHYKTYYHNQIKSYYLKKENLNSNQLINYELTK